MKTRHLLAVPLVAFAACTVDEASLVQLSAICAPPSDAEVCAFPPECEAQWLGGKEIDVAVTDRLELLVQVDNQVSNNANEDTFNVNTNDAWIREYDIAYDWVAPVSTLALAGGHEFVGPFRIPANGSQVVLVLPIVRSVAAELAGRLGTGQSVELNARVRARGIYGDQREFETAEYLVPISVCDGCLDPADTDCDPDPATTVQPFFCPNEGQSPASFVCPELATTTS